MAFAHYSFYSNMLHGIAEFDIILPNDVPAGIPGPVNPAFNRKPKLLILLHGYSGACSDWPVSGNAADLSLAHNLVVVCPSAGNNFYTDAKGTGHAYCSFVGKELPEYVTTTFGLSKDRKDVLIGGYSMGGYGALHVGLTCPDQFSGIMALSSALIIEELKEMQPGFDNGMADYDYYESVFGDLKTAETSELNPKVQIKKLKEENREIPDIYTACGAQDFLIKPNLSFEAFLKDNHISHEFEEGDGVHDFAYWKPHALNGLDYLLRGDHE